LLVEWEHCKSTAGESFSDYFPDGYHAGNRVGGFMIGSLSRNTNKNQFNTDAATPRRMAQGSPRVGGNNISPSIPEEAQNGFTASQRSLRLSAAIC
jgi:hypothetical protein